MYSYIIENLIDTLLDGTGSLHKTNELLNDLLEEIKHNPMKFITDLGNARYDFCLENNIKINEFGREE